jgi:hypothetical protein
MPLHSKVIDQITNGELRTIDGKPCVFYEGYWIRHYDISHGIYDNLANKKLLIMMLTRRVFHNTESGINMPGRKLDETREAYENSQKPAQKRINAAMLAGALLNRATDILTHVVELQKDGVEITSQNELIRQCGKNLMEALELGKQVKHHSGAEGIDELWGEPFKAFSQPIDEFYKSRYLKIGLSMAMIDQIGTVINQTIGMIKGFQGLEERVDTYTASAKLAVETVKKDPVFLDIWPAFIATGEGLLDFKPDLTDELTPLQALYIKQATEQIRNGKNLISYISSARVPMQKSCTTFIENCQLLTKETRSIFGT